MKKEIFLAGAFSPLGFLLACIWLYTARPRVEVKYRSFKNTSRRIKNAVYEQRRLVELQLQDNFSKHFSVEPHLKFKGNSLEIKTLRIPMHEDTEDYYIDEYTYALVKFTIKILAEILKI